MILRLTSAVLLLGGAALLLTWVNAPAAPVPQAGAGVGAAIRAPAAPGVAQVDVERLRARLAAVPSYQTPIRDPFHYGEKSARRGVEPPGAVPVVPPPPPLPRLVAILTSDTGAGPARQIVVSAGAGVKVAGVGDRVGAFVVRAIGTDAADLVDPATGAAFRISIH